MHEYPLCEGVLDVVRGRADGRAVRRVRVRVGVRHRATPEAFQQLFAVAAEGTEAGDAEIELVQDPADLVCHRCGATATVDDPLARCPACASDDVRVSGGDGVVVESITYVGT